jgi:hypothetical protein
MAGYRRRAHGSDASVQRQQPLLRDCMPRSVRHVAIPASATSFNEPQRFNTKKYDHASKDVCVCVGGGGARRAEGQRHLQARLKSIKRVHAAMLRNSGSSASDHVAVGGEGYAGPPQRDGRLLHVRHCDVHHLPRWGQARMRSPGTKRQT